MLAVSLLASFFLVLIGMRITEDYKSYKRSERITDNPVIKKPPDPWRPRESEALDPWLASGWHVSIADEKAGRAPYGLRAAY